MANLPSRLSDAVGGLTGREGSLGRSSVPARIQRAVNEAVAVEHGRGIVQAARVRAVEYVAHESLQAAARLTQMEAVYLQQSPLGEARYRVIADTACGTFANIIAETGR
jgi:hypothetical protein